MELKSIAISVILMVAAVGTLSISLLAQLNQQSAFADRKALEEAGGLCPPGHECSCTAASGVFHDTDPETGRTFNINNGCTSDSGE